MNSQKGHPVPPGASSADSLLQTLLIQHTTPNNLTAPEPITQQFKLQMIFDFYKQQREEIDRLAKERSAITLQFILVSGGLIAAYLQNDIIQVKAGIAMVMIFLGFIGLRITRGINNTGHLHMVRARSAREQIPFLVPFIAQTETFNHYNIFTKRRGARNDFWAWVSIYLGIISIGIAFLIDVLV